MDVDIKIIDLTSLIFPLVTCVGRQGYFLPLQQTIWPVHGAGAHLGLPWPQSKAEAYLYGTDALPS